MAVVLVFGTDTASVGALAAALREAGHTPFAESLPGAAIPEVRAGLFDLILLDGRPAGGDEVCDAARHVTGGGRVPVILLDERGGGPTRNMVCVDAVFYKPLVPARIARVVGMLIPRAGAAPLAARNADALTAASRRPARIGSEH
jgi:DNA-binding response OmpR family regulator